MATLVSYALTTVDDVKENLGIASSDQSKDNLIIRKINQATDMIETYTGRRFKLTTYTNEEYDATGTNQLILKNYPVKTLTAFGTRESVENVDDWNETDTGFYFVDKDAGVLDLNFGTGSRWNSLRVSYEAGFDPIPSDVSEAAASVAAYLTSSVLDNIASGQASGGAAGAIKSRSEGGRKIEYYNSNSSSGDNANSGASNVDIFGKLGLLGTLNNYSTLPILADK